eukprot:GHRQ01010344.1.p1 GENE.GHRQ01010344.1~~GHRQ01010344.1.p1  ORF type:complete len:144 (+),score=15.05 GHRQ01010344.1:392-823(+)
MSTAGASGISGDSYIVNVADQKCFEENGFVLLKQVVTEQELQTVIDPVYHKFIKGEVHVPGKDLCDMSGAHGRSPAEFTGEASVNFTVHCIRHTAVSSMRLLWSGQSQTCSKHSHSHLGLHLPSAASGPHPARLKMLQTLSTT